jgi:hypothetical protein
MRAYQQVLLLLFMSALDASAILPTNPPTNTVPGIVIGWSPVTSTNVAGYAVYYGTNSGTYSTRVDAGMNTTVTLMNLQPGLTYYMVVVDYNSQHVESAPSAEISLLVPGIVRIQSNVYPGGIMLISFPVIPTHWYEIQASSDMKNWVTIGTTPVVTSNVWMACADFNGSGLKKRFYRSCAH